MTDLAPSLAQHRGGLAARIRVRTDRMASSRSPRRHAARRVLLVLFVIGVVLGSFLAGGFFRFAQEVAFLSKEHRVPKADGIVVLTGGALRIDRAIDLLEQGQGHRLLISGVNPGTTAATIARMTGTKRAWFDCCVDLDYKALNTVGNAEIATRWARSKGFSDVILVTSDYHMPRSLREFDRIGTFRSVFPCAVSRPDMWTDGSLVTGLGLRVMVTEYVKLVAARIRSTFDGQTSQLAATQTAELQAASVH